MSTIIPFEFEGSAVRLTDRDGQPWFVLADVCRVLDHSNPSKAAERLDDDEKMTLSNSEGHSGQRGGAQSFTIINESGLYSLILTSRKAAAKRFKKWVTAEVLPSIRKTGGYGAVGKSVRPGLERQYLATLERLVKFQDAVRRHEIEAQRHAADQDLAFALIQNTDLSDEEIAARLPPSQIPRLGFVADCRRWLEETSA